MNCTAFASPLLAPTFSSTIPVRPIHGCARHPGTKQLPRISFLGTQLRRSSYGHRFSECCRSFHAPPSAILDRARPAASTSPSSSSSTAKAAKNIVVVAGFESFNVQLYRNAAIKATAQCPGDDLDVKIFCDKDIPSPALKSALENADVFFGSLLFDYDQVNWLREHASHIPTRLVFESALELMSLTKIGEFTMNQSSGMPKPVKAVLEKFSNKREEDRLVGYLSFLKAGPKLLKWIPVQKVQDLRSWLTIYGFWNEGGLQNVVTLFLYLAQRLGVEVKGPIPTEPVTTPQQGLLHPEYTGYFTSPKEYLSWYRKNHKLESWDWPVVGMLLYRKHVICNLPYIEKLIRMFEDAEILPVPIFINGIEGHVAVRDLITSTYELQRRAEGIKESPALSDEAVPVDVIVSTIGFPLVGGPAGSMEAGRQVEVAKRILSAKNVPYIVAAPLLIQDIKSWTREGINGLQSVVLYALPELDGSVDCVPLGGLVGDDIYLVPERVKRLTGRIKHWVSLQRKPPSERKIAIIVYNFPPGYGTTGTAALLNVPKSLVSLLKALKKEGYSVDVPDDIDGEALIRSIRKADETFPSLSFKEDGEALGLKVETGTAAGAVVDSHTLESWLGWLRTQKITKAWKSLVGPSLPKTFGNEYLIGGVNIGDNVWIGAQPPLGVSGDPMRLLFEKDLTPHPQYAAFYQWIQKEFKADAIIHFGMHGTFEWLPGTPLGNIGTTCWPDYMIGDIPNFYLYPINNPSESILAKRRGYGLMISHNVPPYGRAGLYAQLADVINLINEWRESPTSNCTVWPTIRKLVLSAGLDAECPIPESLKNLKEDDEVAPVEELDPYLTSLYTYLRRLENRLFSSGLHMFGTAPDSDMLYAYLEAYSDGLVPDEALQRLVAGDQPEDIIQNQNLGSCDDRTQEALRDASRVRDLLLQSTDELHNLMRGLNGEYIMSAPGGDLLRDGPGVLPTGRNIHALDPYRMPSTVAFERGRRIANKLIAEHLQQNGSYPETVAVLLWGLDNIKTKGESVGVALGLVGAVPIKEGTGRVVRYELIPLEELKRPRIDVLGNMSGIFRDSFAHVIDLLDDMFLRAAEADEPLDMNFIKKHAVEMKSRGVDNPTARLFSNPKGDFGSLVNDQVQSSSWESGEQLGETWKSRNAFSYGRKDKGAARTEVLESLLQSTDSLVQQIDSVEYGLTDIQEYYANTGALLKSAETARGGRKVQAKFVESFSGGGNAGGDPPLFTLEEVVRTEYRTKLLNPKWAEKMVSEGSGGAAEVSNRMTALIGWSGTADVVDNFVYDQSCEMYALNEEMAAKLRKSNPEAFRNIVGRLLEANNRQMWQTDEATIQRLSDLYQDLDDQIENVG
mmetsp:Transcript_54693/g.90901  ORF Transcript_54693/g.90901 Transcript_54693/m.90901 type:complete len:1358 (+) Transcript_54693:41-4114(+)